MCKYWLHCLTINFVSFISNEVQDPSICRSSASLHARQNASFFIGNCSLHTTTPHYHLPFEGAAINTKKRIWMPPYSTNPGVLEVGFISQCLYHSELASVMGPVNSNARKKCTQTTYRNCQARLYLVIHVQRCRSNCVRYTLHKGRMAIQWKKAVVIYARWSAWRKNGRCVGRRC
jgi:hypothetical protein